MSFNFVFDHINSNNPYPNLAAKINLDNNDSELWGKFPYSVKCRLLDYCRDHDYPVQIWTANQKFPSDSFYVIALAFYNFEIDYFKLLSNIVKNHVRDRKLKILFYYHEGDNCRTQFEDLIRKCVNNNLPMNCFRMISGNTQGETTPNFVYFPDHELQYWHSNRRHQPLQVNTNTKQYDFTLLSRTHKWWRACVVTDFKERGLLKNSLWSYGIEDCGDQWEDNPIDVSGVDNLENKVYDFVKSSPYHCDGMSSQQHNQHHLLVAEHFSNSYINIVLETFFDVDQSQGTFLTEKTFKPIKHGQPFVIAGPPGSLAKLRQLGYKTFDDVIDPKYDTIFDNTQRWYCIRELIGTLQSGDLHALHLRLIEDVKHNQLNFLSSKYNRIRQLEENLNAS